MHDSGQISPDELKKSCLSPESKVRYICTNTENDQKTWNPTKLRPQPWNLEQLSQLKKKLSNIKIQM
jgi:hypothetical protein